jgi:hypothetical protein
VSKDCIAWAAEDAFFNSTPKVNRSSIAISIASS